MELLLQNKKKCAFLIVLLLCFLIFVIPEGIKRNQDLEKQRREKEFYESQSMIEVRCHYIDHEVLEDEALTTFIIARDVIDFEEGQEDYRGHEGEIFAVMDMNNRGRENDNSVYLWKGKYYIATGIYDVDGKCGQGQLYCEIDDIEGGYILDIDCKDGRMNLRLAKENGQEQSSASTNEKTTENPRNQTKEDS